MNDNNTDLEPTMADLLKELDKAQAKVREVKNLVQAEDMKKAIEARSIIAAIQAYERFYGKDWRS